MDSLLDHLCRFTVPVKYKLTLRSFSRKCASITLSDPIAGLRTFRLQLNDGFACHQIPSSFNVLFRQYAAYPLLCPSFNFIFEYRNINRLSIDSALQLRLRPGLTLIRLSLIRKPWSSGVRVSHPHYRYLCLHLLFHTLHKTSQL